MPTTPIFAPGYRFRLETRRKDGTLVAILPHLNMQCHFFLNKHDTLTSEIPMYDPKVTPDNIKEVEHELWLWRWSDRLNTEQLVYSGPLWTIQVDSADKKLKLNSEGITSYLDNRTIDEDLTFTGFYNPWDIARSLITYTQGLADGNLYVALGTLPSNLAYSFTGTYYGYEQRKLAETIDELATQRGYFGTGEIYGFDYRIEPDTRTFEAWLGKRGQARDIILQYGPEKGAIQKYSFQIFGKTVVTSATGQGPGEGENMILSRWIDITARQKYGLHQKPFAAKSAVNASQVSAQTRDYLLDNRTPKRYPQFSLRGEHLDMFDGSFDMGDTCRVIIDDSYIQFDKWIRTIGFGLTIGSEDQETVVLYTEDDNEVSA